MKKFIYIIPVILIFMAVLYSAALTGGKDINSNSSILNIKDKTYQIENIINQKDIKLFELERNKSLKRNLEKYADNITALILDAKSIKTFYDNPVSKINFIIPLENGNMELNLNRVQILTEDFTLKSIGKNGTKKTEPYRQGVYYHGTVKGKSESMASISIFENNVMGIVSDERGNFVLGQNKTSGLNNSYVFYNDADLKIKNNFVCSVGEMMDKFYKTGDNLKFAQNKNMNPMNLPVKMYFEAAYDVYQDFNSNISSVADFVTGFFNSVALLYQNENIPILLKSASVWTNFDPYYYEQDSYPILLKFGGNQRDNFEGNLAHLLSSGHNQELGGIAWIGVLCQSFNPQDSSGRYAFSNIAPNYNGFPTYSWTVNVVTHEIGHNLGSMHTHACWWPLPNNTIGALDSCYTAEGNCFSTPRPSIGTIMSYCHLWIGQGGSVNFNLGFGPKPGDTIRLRYDQAGCLDREMNSSELPVAFDLAQNFPNPFNPSTTINYALPEDAIVRIAIYDLSGREVAVVVNEFKRTGFYSVKFNASGLSSGVYFYRMQAGNYSQTKQMILLK